MGMCFDIARLTLIVSVGVSWCGVCRADATGTSSAGFVAGTAPDRRPDNAPRIQSYDKDSGWYARATAGVTEPVPPSLRFLEDQGAWFTPFNHRGMPGPYDIRHLHQRGAEQAKVPEKAGN